MHTLLKVNLITDDETLPIDLKEAIERALGEVAANDPEGAANAKVALEWRYTVMPRPYMASLMRNTVVQTSVPAPKKDATRKKRTGAAK